MNYHLQLKSWKNMISLLFFILIIEQYMLIVHYINEYVSIFYSVLETRSKLGVLAATSRTRDVLWKTENLLRRYSRQHCILNFDLLEFTGVLCASFSLLLFIVIWFGVQVSCGNNLIYYIAKKKANSEI